MNDTKGPFVIKEIRFTVLRLFMLMCFPSMAPIQLGKFHLTSNSFAFARNWCSVDGV